VSENLKRGLVDSDAVAAERVSRGRWSIPPPSPTFDPLGIQSPDYYPYSESDHKSEPLRDTELEETQEDLFNTKAELVAVNDEFADVKRKFEKLRTRLVYLEGELSVYRRFAVIHSREYQAPTPQFSFPPPPPPPPPTQYRGAAAIY
jgi:hypothetical protein